MSYHLPLSISNQDSPGPERGSVGEPDAADGDQHPPSLGRQGQGDRRVRGPPHAAHPHPRRPHLRPQTTEALHHRAQAGGGRRHRVSTYLYNLTMLWTICIFTNFIHFSLPSNDKSTRSSMIPLRFQSIQPIPDSNPVSPRTMRVYEEASTIH